MKQLTEGLHESLSNWSINLTADFLIGMLMVLELVIQATNVCADPPS